MTLSNFDWTDKNSVKWFVLLPTGHEGPYSLHELEQMIGKGRLAPEVKIWAEGLNEPVALNSIQGEEHITDLPPLPEEELPPLPEEEIEEKVHKPKKVWPFITAVILIMLVLAFKSVIKNFETFDIRRYPKMTLEQHEKILKSFAFDGWNKKIFFKEFLPADHSQIWLITSSFQTCDVEASFQSIPNKLLSMTDEKVSFKSQGQLKNHVVELSSFDFSDGAKIVPGMYEMDVKASRCSWDGLLPNIMNHFGGPDESYVARTKVVLFSKGPEEFNKILDKLLQKKMQLELKEQNQAELFWQDLQQKFETLQAITMQIEQLILDTLDNGPKGFQQNMKGMIDQYTRKFGSFLTTFVVENEKYFQSLDISETKDASVKRNYEITVKLTTKRIGLESMKFIEEFQKMKGRPSSKALENLSERVRKTYAAIKNDISQKIIQVSEDRSK